jgi:predicted nucleic acid-binding protein
MLGTVIDTNVYVAAAFNSKSASACIITAARHGRLQLIWNKPTRREIEMILRQIPRFARQSVADLFKLEGEFAGPVYPEAFAFITDPDDRKFVALSAATNKPLVTSDNHILAHRKTIGIDVVTPLAFLARHRADLT